MPSRVSCLETPEIGTSLVFGRSESLQLPGWRMGRKRVAVWERVHGQVLQLPTRPAQHCQAQTQHLWKFPLLCFFFPSVDFGGTCGSLQQGPKLEADKISVKHICLCSEGMLQESAQAECGRGAALFPGMRQLLVQLQKKNQESPNWSSPCFYFFLCDPTWRGLRFRRSHLADSLCCTLRSYWPSCALASAGGDPQWQKSAEENVFPHLSQQNTSSSQSSLAYPCRQLKLCTEMAENTQISVTHLLTDW